MEMCQCVIKTPAAMTSSILLLLHQIIIIVPSTSAYECHSRELHSLKIEIEDADHLSVSWQDVFQDCQSKDVKAAVFWNSHNAKVKEVFGNVFEKKVASVKLDPCLTHTLSMQLVFSESYNKEHDTPIVKSNEAEYLPSRQVCRHADSGDPVVPQVLESCLRIEWNRTTNLVSVVGEELAQDPLQLKELELCPPNTSPNKVITSVVASCVALTLISLGLAFWLCTKKREIIWNDTDLPKTDIESSVEFGDGYNTLGDINPYETRPAPERLESDRGLYRLGK